MPDPNRASFAARIAALTALLLIPATPGATADPCPALIDANVSGAKITSATAVAAAGDLPA